MLVSQQMPHLFQTTALIMKLSPVCSNSAGMISIIVASVLVVAVVGDHDPTHAAPNVVYDKLY
jgi:hypothetical protein